MSGKRNGLVGRIREKMREENCAALKMENVTSTVTQIVNFIKAKGLNHCQFKYFLEECDSEYTDVPYHTEFLESKGKDTAELREQKFLCELAFLCDISSHLDVLNLKLQGRIITDMYASFAEKLSLAGVDVEKAPTNLQMELIELQCDETLESKFDAVGAAQFPQFIPDTMPQLRTEVTQLLSMFGSTYLCALLLQELHHRSSGQEARHHSLPTGQTGTYARILFVDFSSAFNTIAPDILQQKLIQLAVPASTCQWITSFLTNRRQRVRLGGITSDTRTTNTGAPQGCVLSPLLFSLYTNDFSSGDSPVKLLKYADDTTLIGLIQHGDETAYRQEVERLVHWCSQNHLELNPLKTVEMTVDFRRDPSPLLPLTIRSNTILSTDTFKFLGTTISRDLNWTGHIDSVRKKAQQRLYFLSRTVDSVRTQGLGLSHFCRTRSLF
ncbi:uncharacterized protein ACBT44_016340 [Syngnathus typhle]